MLVRQCFVERRRLLEVPNQLLNFERGEDDKVTHSGHLKRWLLHRHRVWRQAQPIDYPFEVWLHQQADDVVHVLLNDCDLIAGAQQRRFAFLFLPVALAGRLSGDLKLLWGASTWTIRRLLRLFRRCPEISLMMIDRRRSHWNI